MPIFRIKEEGLQRSAGDGDGLVSHRCATGRRLTNSPGMRAAADWAMTRLTGWGLTNVQQGDVGTLRARLGQRAARDDELAPVPAPLTGISARLDTGHHWHGLRRRRARRHRA